MATLLVAPNALWASQTTFVAADSVNDFTGIQGSGGWYYGYDAGGGFTQMTVFEPEQFSQEEMWFVDQGTYWTVVWATGMHPNGTTTSGGRTPILHKAVRRWVSDVSGPLLITGAFHKQISGGNGVTGSIVVDGQTVFTQDLVFNDVTGVTFSVPVASVSLGSTVDFVLDPKASNDISDGSIFTAIINWFPCGSPATNCRSALRSLLLLKDDPSDDAKDKLIWKWIKGQSTSQSEFGDPTVSTDYALCVYAGTAATLLTEAKVPTDAMKWSMISTKGYKYKDKPGTATGVQKIVLKGSTQNKAKALMKAKGEGLPDVTLGSLPLPVTAQFLNSDTNVCLEGVYDMADVIKNESKQFKAKAQ